LAHESAPCARGVPAVENFLHFLSQAVEVRQLLFQQRAHVNAWPTFRRPQVDDVADLLQRKAEPARLGDEVQDVQDLSVVHAIAGWGPPRLRHDAACFIEAQRLAADPATDGDLSDRQSVLGHGPRINLTA